MKMPIKKDNPDKGRIYILRIVDNPGLVKIGRTTKMIWKRKGQINRCINRKVEAINDDNHANVPDHQRVEKLIHAELWHYERTFHCLCKQNSKRKKYSCEDHDGLTAHGEWFEIPEAKAIEVVGRWTRWISTDPYRNGKLKSSEVLRIDACAQNPDHMNSMIAGNGINKDNGFWRWDDFLGTSGLYLRYLWLHQLLYAKRFEKNSDCSRWDSFLKHWKSNVAFGLWITGFSVVMSIFRYLLPSCIAVLAVVTIAVLASSGILYAA